MPRHYQMTGSELHKAHAWEYANSTAREAASGFQSDDIRKTALQLDDFSTWILVDTTPTWSLGAHGVKLSTIEDNAEVNNISDINATALVAGTTTALHIHSTDRDRVNHSGQQLANTISNFDATVSANADVTANTSHRGSSSNPHSVTKTQLSLENVPNVDCTNASNLSTGTVPSSVLPPVAITSTFVVASQVEQLALSVQEGDVAIRTDESKSYIRNVNSAGDMTDWNELQTPTDTILSVNTKTGTVVLNQDDVANGSTYVRTVNDFTNTLKTKLDGIDASANAYVHPTNHDSRYYTETEVDDNFLGKTATAADSSKLGGLSGSASSVVSTVVQRNGSGDAFARYFNTNATAQTNAPSHLFVSIGDDGYIRKQPLANAKANLGINAKAPIANPTFTGTVTAPAFNATSKREAKENIETYAESATDILSQVKVVEFNYKADERKFRKVGFIADDTDPILSTPYQDTMDMTNAIGLLIKANQELTARVDALENKEI